MTPCNEQKDTKPHDGLRVSLLVDSAIIIAGLVTATLMYGDVQNLKQHQVSEGRVVAIEVQLRNLSAGVDGLQDQQAENTRRIIDTILRERDRDTDRKGR
ncbi:MAG: hypothetical protein DYH20_01000 [Gammaproteobacteria bacterium PRO9]|nr:hypothetical protein [Gammaproteobacteria bacterium PRO9]